MIDSTIKKEYKSLIKSCDFILNRHPDRSMAEQLQDIIPLSEQFDEQDVYGEGELITGFEQEIADLLGKQAVLFLPSGTMAQPMALRIWADHHKSEYVGFHATSHLELHEFKAYQNLYGLKSVLLGDRHKVVTLNDLQKVTDPLAVVLLELPMREIGGQLPEWSDLQKKSEWAKQNNIALHMDGARLWQCTEFYQKSLAEIADLFDSVYVSFYKDLNGIAASVLAGPEWFIKSARTWSRRCGGNLYSLYPYVLAAKSGLDKNLPHLPEMIRTACWLADYFNQFDQLQTIPLKPPTNLFHLRISQDESDLMPKVLEWTKRTGVVILPFPRESVNGYSIFEFSIGFNALKAEPAQWKKWIDDFVTSLL